MKTIFSLIVLFLLFSSCSALMGEEVGRIPVNKISEDEDHLVIKEIELDLKKGQKLAIWSEIDLESEGDLALEFRLRIFHEQTELEMKSIFPFKGNITMNEKKTQLNDKLDWSFSKKNDTYVVPESGHYTFAAILVSNGNKNVKINKAELVFRK